MFGVELDIRTLAFVATLSAIIQALTFSSLWMVSRRDNATMLWAIGGIANALGFVLLGFRGYIPDLASVVVGNTLIAAGHAFYLLGLQAYTTKKPSYRSVSIAIAAYAALFVYYLEFVPDFSMRVVVISVTISAVSLAGCLVLAQSRCRKLTAPEILMAITFAAHCLFHLARGIVALIDDEAMTQLMSASTIHMLAFLDVIIFLLLTAVGFTAMIIISLNLSLMAEARAKNRLFTVLAHDLRTPFHGLAGLSLMAQQDLVAGNPAQALGNIRKLHSSTAETLRFLDDLLVWGRTLFDQRKPERSTIALDELVNNTIKVSRPLLETKSVRVISEVDEPTAYGIAPHAEMILRNLLVNAIKFSNPHGSITVSTQKAADKIQIKVIDRGVGASDDMIAAFTASTSYGSKDGTGGEIGSGVGLSLCRDLCREDGEDIWLEHNPEGGLIATFTLSVPPAE
ncbi:HAMP domain-containing sensor histidine kinase [Thalassospira sp.]|uniref:sensor histidine kinase n=1 Tax=Thalassospira sp. TaxID=1912094 RepID=UPI0025E29436|nr:HAMP domain-containing sensor histidine kinase [Thalassospira sp.]|tara:strand:+ start:3797 stop:5161 length:1365 start_codon:yes stop_codon:yes gene_type:complete